MTDTLPMCLTGFAGAKRIVVNRMRRTVTVQGKRHIDNYVFEKAQDRVALYQGLAKRPKHGHHYAAPLAAAEKAAALVMQAEGRG